MNEFAGKAALVVGGTSGIGLAVARAFAREGANVVFCGRSAAAAERAHELFGSDGTTAQFVSMDVTDAASVAQGMESAVNALDGAIDVAFNNAGWESSGMPAVDVPEAEWHKMLDTKLTGTWRCVQHELRIMQASKTPGSIVNMAGNWGLVGFPGYASYCAAAHGIMGLTKAIAKEVASQGIRVNAVCPGAVDSPMLERMVGGDRGAIEGFGQSVAMGRVATPQDVASAVLWLSSPGASYVTGHGLVLDGGG